MNPENVIKGMFIIINRPEIFELINGRRFHFFDAKYKNMKFDDAQYTQTVLDKIEHSNDLSYQENGFTLLHLAVQEYEYDFVKALLEKKIDVNASTKYGITPLHTAISRYKGEISDKIIRILLKHGANYAISFGGMSAIEFAAQKGIQEKFEAMLSKQ